MGHARIPLSIVFVALACGCVSNATRNIAGPGSQLATRQVQTRSYEVNNKEMAMRSVIATLQDLGFTIDQADLGLGVITATRLHEYTMRMTVTVVDQDDFTMSVRASARIDEDTVRDAVTYQDFFAALDKAMFFTRNNID